MSTTVQRKVLTFVESYQAQTGGVSPSYAEIGKAVGIASKSRVSNVLDDLEKNGLVRRLRTRARAIEIVRRYRVFRFDNETKELKELK